MTTSAKIKAAGTFQALELVFMYSVGNIDIIIVRQAITKAMN